MIELISSEQLRQAMNRSALKRTPFLFAIDFECENALFVENPMEQTEILWRTPQQSNFLQQHLPNGGSFFRPTPLSFADYERKFNIIHNGLLRGDSFLTNLTVKTPLSTDYTLREIALQSTSPYLLLIPDHLVCFSPEIFVRINLDNGRISSNPMKGTWDASPIDAEAQLLNDPKERAEHYTVVDLIRNDLSIVASDVTVEQFRYVERLQTSRGAILQSSSLIAGCLTEHYTRHIADAIFAMLPAGSVSGAPKPSTLSLIRQAEGEKRGFYCGVFGYFDGQQLDSAVMIRFIEQDVDGRCCFRSGSGITAKSDARFEYDEIIQKVYY